MFRSFLKDRAVNLLNFHFGIMQLGIAVEATFGMIYLYQIGLPLWQVFAVSFFSFLIRFFTRPAGLWLARKIGVRKDLILGSLIHAGLYLILWQVDGLNAWLLVYIFWSALNDITYWLAYHSYFAALGDTENRGKSIGLREALGTLASAIGPLVAGILITAYGFDATFIAAAVITLLASVPLFFTPEVSVGERMSFREALREVDKRGFWLLVGDGWYYFGETAIWNLVLFFLVGDYVIFGGLVALSTILQMVGFLFFGGLVDRGKSILIYRVAFSLTIPVLLGRAIFAYTIPVVIFFDLLFALRKCFSKPVYNNSLYNSSRRSKNILWFHFFAEAGWDIGSMIATAFGIVLTYFGGNLRWAMAFSLGGILVVYFQLWQYYERRKKTIS